MQEILEASQNGAIVFNAAPQIVSCPPDWSWNPGEALIDFDFWIVLDGQGEIRTQAGLQPIQRGSCFIHQPGDYPLASHDPTRCLRVFYGHFDVLKPSGRKWGAGELALTRGAVQSRRIGQIEQLARLILQQWKANAPNSQRRCELAAWQILLQLDDEARASNNKPIDERLERVLHTVEEDPSAYRGTADMAEAAGLSHSHFIRRFSAEFGLSPNRYLIERRIEQARYLVEESSMSLGQVAESLGYRDLYFFSRQFKQVCGVAPSQLRKGASRTQ